MANIEPPFEETLKTLHSNSPEIAPTITATVAEEYCHLPLVDLSGLNGNDDSSRGRCLKEMATASTDWGFFQVVNHGIPVEVLERLMNIENDLFHQPFEKKSKPNFLNLGSKTYRWGNPKAKSLNHLSFSEALHIPITDISRINESNSIFRETVEDFAREGAVLVQKLAECLAETSGMNSCYFRQNCPPNSSYLRLNRYPPCPFSAGELYGLVPHTDSSILTLVYQDQVGGLQLLKDGKWLNVKATSNALLINIGDLFQAMSNGVYKSVRHRVVAQGFERFSAAYFYYPTAKTVIQSFRQPALYKPFTFREYRRQVEEDVKNTGDKIGLSRFIV